MRVVGALSATMLGLMTVLLCAGGAAAAEKIVVQVPVKTFSAFGPNAPGIEILGLREGLTPAEVRAILISGGYTLDAAGSTLIVSCGRRLESQVTIDGNEYINRHVWRKKTPEFSDRIEIYFTSLYFGNGLYSVSLSRVFATETPAVFSELVNDLVSRYGKYAESKSSPTGVAAYWYWMSDQPLKEVGNKKVAELEVWFGGGDGKVNKMSLNFQDNGGGWGSNAKTNISRDAICEIAEKAVKDAAPKALELP